MYNKSVTNWKIVIKVSITTILIAVIISLVTELIVMSKYATVGYEIEQLQIKKARLQEENARLRNTIAEYHTTDYYMRWAQNNLMRKTTKVRYLSISGDDRIANQ